LKRAGMQEGEPYPRIGVCDAKWLDPLRAKNQMVPFPTTGQSQNLRQTRKLEFVDHSKWSFSIDLLELQRSLVFVAGSLLSSAPLGDSCPCEGPPLQVTPPELHQQKNSLSLQPDCS
jgi:hypothetical protein